VDGLKQMLKVAGIDPERDVKIGPVPGFSVGQTASFGLLAAKALEEGKIDGFWANGMGAEVAVRSGAGTIVIDARRGDGPPKAIHWNEGFGSILRLCTALFATKALGDEREYERVEGNSFRFGARGELRMHCLWDTSYELAGCDAAAVGRWHGQFLCLQRSDGGFECITAALDSIIDALAI